MRIYGTAASPFVARVRIQLLAKDLPLELVAPPGGVGSPELRALSPLGRIPILEVAARCLPESGVIQEYLEDVYPQPALRGSSPLETAEVRLIARIVDLYLVPALQPLRAAFASVESAQVVTAMNSLEGALNSLEPFLGEQGWAVGHSLSLADCALAPVLFYVRRFAEGLLPQFSLQPWSRLQACEQGMKRHPAVATVLAEMSAAVSRSRPQA